MLRYTRSYTRSLTHQSEQFSSLDKEEMFLLIRACANQGAFEEAIVWCQRAIATDALNPRFYYLLATVLLEQSREEEAMLALRQTLYLDNEFVLAHFTLANLSRRQKKTKDRPATFSECPRVASPV